MLAWSGGGGYGDPLDRDPEAVPLDVSGNIASVQRMRGSSTASCLPKPTEPSMPRRSQAQPLIDPCGAHGRIGGGVGSL